jgi:integrase
MKQRFRLYQRGGNGRYYVQDNTTGKQESLGTSDRAEALRLCSAKNEAAYQPAFNAQIAKTYLAAGDPEIGKRTWEVVMEVMKKSKEGTAERTRARYESAFKEHAFDSVRSLVIIETRPEHIFGLLQSGTMSTNMFMRRLHSFALSMGWLPWPILSFKQWPVRRFEARRAITEEEAAKLIAIEKDSEWKAFLELIWHIGAAQVDLASLSAENVDWTNRTISYHRQKTGTLAIQRFGCKVEAILKRLPQSGPLFPHYSKISSADRATRFNKRCKKLGITGVSLHSYRYAWAERARTFGYPERYAMDALGHSSAAVSRFYAKGARVEVPPLEDYERQGTKIVPLARMTEPCSELSVAVS